MTAVGFLLSKLLPVLVLPVGIVLLLLATAIATKRRAPAVLAFLVLYAFATPLVSSSVARWVEGDQVRALATDAPDADAIVVLSSSRTLAPGPGGVSEWGDSDRFFGGLELVRAGKAPWLLFTGGTHPFATDAELEGDVLTRYAVASGVPRDRVRTTGPVTNTAEEAAAIATLLASLPDVADPPHVLLVTSAFHVPRAQALFERAGMTVTPFPVDFMVDSGRTFSPLDLAPSASALRTSERALREVLGRVVYRVP